MRYLRRPWAMHALGSDDAFGPDDCLLGAVDGPPIRGQEHVSLLRGQIRGQDIGLALFPYPKRDHGAHPARIGFPVRPRGGQDPTSPAEQAGAEALTHMNSVLARVQELGEALEDASDIWGRLRAAWQRAESQADPRMAEIIRQSRDMQPALRDLAGRIRRVLRRHRELTPLSRVQEMDRGSMAWLSRQPGRTIPERAGPGGRILAVARREDFDTLENRVLHAYAKLAAQVAREWMREHPKSSTSNRYEQANRFRKSCRTLTRTLADLGVMVASAGITPNYVLMQDKSYRQVHESWLRLLQRQKIEDDLWAWQAETWTDFAVLAITLALDELDEAQLIAQSPIDWRDEAVCGRWFTQDRPIAVFWLRQSNLIVEVQSRLEVPGALLTAARAHVALRITDVNSAEMPRRVAVWTPHAMGRLDLDSSAAEAAHILQQIQPLGQSEVLRHGLIVTPARGQAGSATQTRGSCLVHAIALGPRDTELTQGFAKVRAFVRDQIYGGQA